MAYVVQCGMEEHAMPGPTTSTVKVQLRHSIDCKQRHKGVDFKGCRCPKILRLYDGGGSGANRRITAKTRSWEEAEKQAQAYRDALDPVRAELNRLKSEKERQRVPIEKAVALYLADMVARLGNNRSEERRVGKGCRRRWPG